MIQVNQNLVPRERVAGILATHLVVKAPEPEAKPGVPPPPASESEFIPAPIKESPAVIAQIYHYAIAASTTLALAAALIWQCLVWQWELRKFTTEGVKRWLYVLLPIFALGPIVLAYRDAHIIDDEAVVGLFSLVNLDAINPPFLFANDSRILGAAIFTAFLFSAATTALAAAGSPEAYQSKAEVDRRMAIVRSALLATSVVLVGALVASKLRLDTGTFMLGGAGSPAAIAFQTVANAVMNYWAAVLSIGLAFIYGPPALFLYSRLAATGGNGSGARDESKWLTSENVMRVVRLLAVLAPPIVAAGLEVLPN